MGSSVSTFHNIHIVASGSGGEETWHHLVTSFVATQFAFCIFHYRWQKCSQPITGLY